VAPRPRRDVSRSQHIGKEIPRVAPPEGHIRPWRYLASFVGILAILYSVVFFTGDGKATPELGIDLQGGTRVTLTARTPDGSEPTREQLDQARQIIEQRVNGLGVSGAEVVQQGSNLVITVPGEKGEQARTLGQTAKLYFREVLAGPVPVQPPAPPGGQQDASGGDRPGAGGAASPDVAAQIAKARELRQSTDPQQQQQALQQLDCSAPDPLRGNALPDRPLVTCNQEGTAKYILAPAFMSGEQIQDASYGIPPNRASYVVNLDFTPRGADIWGQWTGANVGQLAGIVLDGQVVSAPVVQEANSTGRSEISGQFTQAEAKELANILKYGALPLSFETSEAQTVSPTLGLASLQAGLVAGAIGLAAVFVYCLFYYRMLGLLTILSLILSGAVVYAVLVLLGRWIGFTLDLAGVAGFIVAIGITADSFVVFFERLKDEIRDGRTFRSAVPRGWVRARRTILAADAVSFLAAAVLYVLAVGQVKGFAFTLGMSTVLDLVVVFLVTHPLVVLISQSKTLSRPSLSGLGAVQRMAAARARPAGRAAVKGA
jgi:preprotein translocase subunit SecD